MCNNLNMVGDNTSVKSIPLDGKIDDRRHVSKEPKPFEDLPPEIQRILEDRREDSKTKKTTLRMMEGKYVMSILCYINQMAPVVKSDVYNNISRANNMASKIDDLETLGLIRIYRTAKTNTNVIVMTPKGKKVADMIMLMVNTIDRERPDLD